MKIPFFDLSRQARRLRSELEAALMEVVDSQQFILGPALGLFEEEVARVLQARNAIGVASGSDALLLALMAGGIGPDAEVIVPSFSFFATASTAVRLGARIVFADIDPDSFHVDPDDIGRRITPRTRAIVAAHLFGDCAEIETLARISGEHGLLLIEDAAQAFGALHRGQPAGTFGFCGCFSFYPTKNLAAMGDGGLIVAGDDDTALKIRLLANHGVRRRYEHVALGINSRLDSLQAAVLRVKLRYVAEWNERRRAIAARYTDALRDVVTVPSPSADNTPVFHQFVVRTPRRDELRDHLAREGIGTEIYYPIPLHLQEGLAPFCGKPGDFPGAEEAAGTVLALPVFPELEDGEVETVIASIRAFLKRG